MSSASSQSGSWGFRWWAAVIFISAAQLALLVWLGEKEGARPASAAPGAVLQVVDALSKERLALPDPTLFALPHREAFSGSAWLSVSNAQEIKPFVWTEPAEYLNLLPQQLAACCFSPEAASPPDISARLAEFPADLSLPAPSQKQLFPDRSAVYVAGGLRGRPMRTRFELPSRPNPELLTNSVVQLLVDAEGAVLSAILLGPGCGLKEADDYAVSKAAVARFAPVPHDPEDTSPFSGLTWGELVFQWHTLPSTNNPGQKR